MKRIIAAMAVTVMLTGCAQVYPADPTTAEGRLADVNRAINGRRVRVRMLDMTEFEAENVTVALDSTSLTPTGRHVRLSPWRTAVGRTLRTSEIETITVARRGQGALRGALFGFAIGAAAGFAIGGSSQAASGMAAVYLGVLGSGVGLLYGVLVGSKDVYDFTKAPKETSRRRRR